jgi:RNA polymerase sigma factor (sigma-70 family)
MGDPATTVLVRKAKSGDRSALSVLVDRFYSRWLTKFHGDLCTTIRKGYDTADLVQSALRAAMEDLPTLSNEGAFFTWVTTIIRHKIAAKRRRWRRERPLEGGGDGVTGKPQAGDDASTEIEREETLVAVLEDIIRLFPEHPDAMTVIILRQLDSVPIAGIAERLGTSQRRVFRLLKEGHELLRKRWSA